ncbi:MAG: hypothetical protein K8I60_12910 [Anaerolineae bacterium]|nr:hypothetical protein [Anaerolineae bacterium]
MTNLVESEIVLVAVLIILFLTGLTGIIALMSLLRHRRHSQQDRILAAVPGYGNGGHRPAEETLEQIRLESSPRAPKNIPIPAHLRLPIQPGTPDQLVLHITPTPEKTLEQRNIERIIDYFKKDTAPAGIN